MAVKNIVLVFLFIVFVHTNSSAQIFSLEGTSASEIRHEQQMYSSSCFPSIRPWKFDELFHSENTEKLLSDSVFFPMLKTDSQWSFMSRIEPYLETTADMTEQTMLLSHTAAAISVLSSYKNLFFQGTMRRGYMNPLMARYYADSLHIIPGMGMTTDINRSSLSYVVPRFSFIADISEHFYSEAGLGTHFFGDGKRSLILSDEQYPYPYLKLTTNIWKLRYVNLFAWQRDVQSTAAVRWKDGRYKFNAMHYLSWNAGKRLKLSVFEAIVCPLYDSLMQRQFMEYNYLLPVVMFRPLDFALGSPDNVLFGFNASYTAAKHVFYAQLVMDEMFMNEIRADVLQFFFPDSSRQHGAWVNKQALQLGWKYYDMFGIDHLDALAEVNVIRPFTFAHRDVQQNYTHLNQPLAHPLGSNLIELTGRFRYTGDKWVARLEFSAVKTGLDSSGTLYGNDIFKTVFDAPIEGLDNIPVQYYGNNITQGIPCHIFYISGAVSRVIIPQYNIWGEMGFSQRTLNSSFKKFKGKYVHFGVKWGMGSDRKGL